MILEFVDDFLSRITMYRLMLYFLLVLLGAAIVESSIGVLGVSPFDIISNSLFLILICYLTNQAFAKLLKVQTNFESQLITALILSLIVGPFPLLQNIWTLLFIGVAAMVSKYILAFKGKHVFNPAALGVFMSGLMGYLGAAVFYNPGWLNSLLNSVGAGASWWGGSYTLLPFVILGGLLVARKLKRFGMIFSFFLPIYIFYLVLMYGLYWSFGMTVPRDPLSLFNFLVVPLFSPALFFVFIMLVEPLTSPVEQEHKVAFGLLVASLLIAFQTAPALITFTQPYSTELSLLCGNIFAFIVRKDIKTGMVLKKKEKLSSSVTAFWFEPIRPFIFIPGQYLEWTLPHKNADSRGTRRYFTIAASPTEKQILLTTRFVQEMDSTSSPRADSPRGSSFKDALRNLEVGKEISAGALQGSFVMSNDKSQKYLWIAGGIGITPFRSMTKYLVDTKDKRDVVLLYSARTPEDLVFKDLFDSAQLNGIRSIYTITESIPQDWKGERGFITVDMVKSKVPDYMERLFYISGPEPMVKAFVKMFVDAGVPKGQIKRDYFPGYSLDG